MLQSDIDAFIASDPASLERSFTVSSVSFLCCRFASLLVFLGSHRRASSNRIKVLSNIYFGLSRIGEAVVSFKSSRLKKIN